MESTRREVLVLILGGVVGAACGGSSPGPGGSANGGNCLANGTQSTIESNHGHVLVVSTADINAGVTKSYDIQGTADHAHSVTLTAADFASLEQNTGVDETSTTNASAIYGTHAHTILVSCA